MMMILMVQKNYDPSTFLRWYRKLDRHPDPAMCSLAEDFCGLVASWLEMDHPPAIFWFEDVDFIEAKQGWLADPGVKPQAADPLREVFEYFRWRSHPSVGHVGYTHRESPLGIMINISRRGEELLDTVAEECFHIYQDFAHGPGWRAEAGDDAVEGEAREFVSSRAPQIHAFLESWNKGRSPDGSFMLNT